MGNSTSLKLAGFFFLLSSTLLSFGSKPEARIFPLPEELLNYSQDWQNHPFGIFSVAIQECPDDTQPPTLSLESHISRSTDAGQCTAAIAIPDATFDDNCTGASLSWSMSGATAGSGDGQVGTKTFNPGTTTITYTVTDAANLSTTGSLTVTVEDNEAPAITAPADQTANTNSDGSGNCTTTVDLGTPTVTENCDTVTVKAFVDGSEIDPATFEFPVGTTTVTWKVNDSSANSSSDTQQVIVEDNEAPSITAPADLTENTNSDSGDNCTTTVDLGTPTTSDNCETTAAKAFVDGSEIDPATFEFPVGTTIVTWEVSDSSANSSSDTQQVIVEDNQAPSITAPTNITANTNADGTGNCTTTVDLGTPTTSDNCETTAAKAFVDGSEIDPATFEFPVGTTTVTWKVNDSSANSSSDTQQVIVKDNEAPSITAPADVTANTNTDGAGNCTTTVDLGTPTISDNCETTTAKAFVNGSEIDPGTFAFPIGTTTVSWKTSDASGNSSSATQKVQVTDNQKPVITAGADITLANLAGQCYAGVQISPATASDNCSVATPIGTRSDGQPLNATYPVGTTTITWAVTDANGNAATPVTQNIIVEDKEAPLVPELKKEILSGCAYTFELPSTTDNCDSSVSVTYNGSLTFSTTGEITWTFTDDAGNSATATQKIIIDPIVVISVDKVDVLCNGLATGSIAAQASGGVPPYTYDWGSLGAGEKKTDLKAGTYYVKATDANGCSTAPLEVVITEPGTFVAISSIKTTTGCYQQNNGTATVEATGGVGNYSYWWSNGQTTQKATGLAPGSHSVTVTDANGCSKSRNFTISTPQQLQITGFLTTETTSYGSSTGTATAQISGGTPNYTFKWSNGATGQTARDLAAGKYQVTVTDANGCTATRELTIIDALDAVIMPTSICEGEEDIVRTSYFEVEGLKAKGGTPGYTYSWNFGESAMPATATGPGPHRVKYAVIGDKKVTLRVTDSKGLTLEKQIVQYVGGCFSNDCGSNDLAADNYFIGDAFGKPITSANCAAAGQKYLYISFPTESTRYSLNIEYIYSKTNLSTGVTENFREAGCYYSQQIIPKVAQTIPIDYKCGDLITIEGIYLTFSNNSNWKCGQGPAPKCYSTNNQTSVTLPLYAVAFPNELLCNGGTNGVVNVRASGGTGVYSYKLISAADGGTVEPSQPSSSFTGLSAGKYKVVVSDGVGSYTTAEVEVKQPVNPLKLTLESTTGTTCYGGTDGSATVKASGGTPNTTGEPYIYSWANIGQTTPTATNLSAGTYSVRVIDANGCEISLDVEITQPAELLASAGPDQVLECGNLSTTLAAVFNPEVVEGKPAPTGTWTIVNGPAGGVIANVNDPFSAFSGNVGTYTLRWTVPCGTTDDVKISLGSCSTLDFDGINDHVVIGDKFDLPAGFTLEAWVKQNPGKTAGVKTILSERDLNNPTAGFDLVIDNNVPKFRWNGSEISSTYPIGTDRWYHIAVIAGGENAGLYVDGIKVSSGAPGQPTATTNPFIIGAAYNSTTPQAPQNYFHGWIEEVRVWKKTLIPEQVRFLMNQRLNIGTSPLQGTALPLAVPGGLESGTDLIAYYPLIVSEITNGTTVDKGPNAFHGKMVNIKTLQENTAPLPYYSAKNGTWTADDTWLRPAVWDHPNSLGIDGSTFIDWNIVVSRHNISSTAKDIRVLGLRSEAGKLTISNPSGPQNENNSGQLLHISHYLLLNGVIDLVGKSQLVQPLGSIIDKSSTGYLERDQQGTASSYNYNYWSSPVALSTTNMAYSIKAVMKDGTITTFRDLDFGNTYHYADGAFTNPRKVSNYWLHKFHGTANNYFSWEHVGSTGTLKIGEGYSMKGTSGYAPLTDLQNYTFRGMPNNGEIKLELSPTTAHENYLVGNPYPSAIDAEKFIKSNIISGDVANSSFNGSLYFWHHFAGQTHYLERYIGGYAVINLGGSVEPATSSDSRIDNSNPNLSGNKRPGQFIPVGQAFFVNTVYDVNGGTQISTGGTHIVFNNRQREYKREGIDKDAENKDQVVFFDAQNNNYDLFATSDDAAEPEQSKIWLKFKSPAGYHRQILVTADVNTTDNFDLGYDGPLIEDNLEDMYWLVHDSEFVIQGVPDFADERELALGIKTREGGNFSISIDDLENVPANLPIYVKDSIKNVYHDLRESEFKGIAETGTEHNRYSVVFSSPQDPDPEEEEGNEEDGDSEGDETGEENPDPDGPETELPLPKGLEMVYSNTENTITIKNPHLIEISGGTLYNGLGQEIRRFTGIPTKEIHKLPLEVRSAGVYFINLNLKEGSASLKFLIE